MSFCHDFVINLLIITSLYDETNSRKSKSELTGAGSARKAMPLIGLRSGQASPVEVAMHLGPLDGSLSVVLDCDLTSSASVSLPLWSRSCCCCFAHHHLPEAHSCGWTELLWHLSGIENVLTLPFELAQCKEELLSIPLPSRRSSSPFASVRSNGYIFHQPVIKTLFRITITTYTPSPAHARLRIFHGKHVINNITIWIVSFT